MAEKLVKMSRSDLKRLMEALDGIVKANRDPGNTLEGVLPPKWIRTLTFWRKKLR